MTLTTPSGYLGDPRTVPENYRRMSILDEVGILQRPVMLVHGLADDNVLVAHTLRLSERLLAAGSEHGVLLLPRITHSAAHSDVLENLLLIEAEFLNRVLGTSPTNAP